MRVAPAFMDPLRLQDVSCLQMSDTGMWINWTVMDSEKRAEQRALEELKNEEHVMEVQRLGSRGKERARAGYLGDVEMNEEEELLAGCEGEEEEEGEWEDMDEDEDEFPVLISSGGAAGQSSQGQSRLRRSQDDSGDHESRSLGAKPAYPVISYADIVKKGSTSNPAAPSPSPSLRARPLLHRRFTWLNQRFSPEGELEKAQRERMRRRLDKTGKSRWASDRSIVQRESEFARSLNLKRISASGMADAGVQGLSFTDAQKTPMLIPGSISTAQRRYIGRTRWR